MRAPIDGAISGEMLRARYGASASESRPHEPGFHHILVVDDEAGIRDGSKRILTAEGHVVLLASSGEEGLQTLAANPDIDVALVDLNMPGIDGLEFLSRAAEVAPETICVVVAEYASLDTAIESTKRGAYDILTKPFTSDQLVRAVNKALAGAHLLRERNRVQEQKDLRMLEVATEQSRLRTIINCMNDGVIVCNAERKLVLYNPAALRVLTNVDPGQCVLELSDAIRHEELVGMINQASADHNRLSRELELHNGSSSYWLLADVAPVADERSGQFMGTVTVLRDITKIKKVEELKAQFVNMVAHELRAPLSAVSGYLSVMLEGMVADPAKQREMLSRSNERIKALLDLVTDLLHVSRMEAGTVSRTITGQQIPELLHDVAALMQPLADDKKVTISVSAPKELPRVEADREELIRLFNNLVSNAIKYNREGGAVILQAAQDGHYVRISVQDTGIGISNEGLERLFTEFFREKRPETAYVTGTGLGLSIVKRVVDFYHGKIKATSELGQGSTFTVWLPFRYEPEQAALDESTGDPPCPET